MTDVALNMSWPPAFEPFPKIPRLRAAVVTVTEKLDGTNAQVLVPEDPALPIIAGSRSRWLTPGKHTDNFGFAAWVAAHELELRTLGAGRHYGEWYGAGIQRGYGLDHKRLALFNVRRWWGERRAQLPACVGVVPLLYQGAFDTVAIMRAIDALRDGGSVAVPGFTRPEGIVLEYGANRSKLTFDGDGAKGAERQDPELRRDGAVEVVS